MMNDITIFNVIGKKNNQHLCLMQTEKSKPFGQWINSVEPCFRQNLLTLKFRFLSLHQTSMLNSICTAIHRYPILSMRYSVMCRVYTGYHGSSEIEHGLCICMVDNPLAKALGLSPYRCTNHALFLTCLRCSQ